jgi:NADH-quinone oxidoreductase subunit E
MVDTKYIDKDIVVCNINNCLNCGNCVAACQRRHKDVSRHRRAGSSFIGISLFPNLCRICKDPKCIKACNRNGIEKDIEGHIVVTDNCVGCGMCIRACPYNAILLFSGEEGGTTLIDKALSFFKVKEREIEHSPEQDDESIDEHKVEDIIMGYGGGLSNLLPILQDIQEEFNYLPQQALRKVARLMDIPISQVFSVATFYKAFSLVPRGRHGISVCVGTACHVRGAEKVLKELERRLAIKAGETTQDKKFTLNCVNCLGACALGPVMLIDGEYFGKVTPDKVGSILEKFD